MSERKQYVKQNILYKQQFHDISIYKCFFSGKPPAPEKESPAKNCGAFDY